MIHHGDLFDVLPTLEAESIDACVTDPPYGLGFMGKLWDTFKPGVAESRIVPNRAIESDNPNLRGRTRGPASSPSAVEYDRSLKGQHEFQTWCEAWAREVYRVLKPGAHLLVCGAPRSGHRMICGIEDAGFEIRDSLCWLFGQGFPKSLDVSKAIDKAAGAERQITGLRRHGDGNTHGPRQHGSDKYAQDNWTKASADRWLMETHPATADAKRWAGWGTALKPGHEIVILARKPLGERGIIVANLSRLEAQLWSLLPANAASENFRLSPSDYAEACASAQWSAGEKSSTQAALFGLMDTSRCVSVLISSLNIVSSWRRMLADIFDAMNTSTIETESSTTTDWKTLRYCSSVLTPADIIKAETNEPGSACDVSDVARYFHAALVSTHGTLTLSVLGPVMSKAAEDYQDEDGPRFSPAYEPIVVARKPLIGTVAENVQKFGTGAINVDACRIQADWENDPNKRGWQGTNYIGGSPFAAGLHDDSKAIKRKLPSLGRWPANVCLDEEAAKMLDDMSGDCGANGGGLENGSRARASDFHMTQGARVITDNAGGASRFFYTAKPSRAERNHGIWEGRSTHPTVKPVELMRWLVKLVTPPGGTVLDPFCGSGTTGMACAFEFFQFIGIEREAEYVEIAKRRIASCAPLFTETADA